MSPGGIGRWGSAGHTRFIQQKHSTTTGTVALTPTSALSAGSLLVVVFGGFNGIGTPSVSGVSDSNNTWQRATLKDNSSAGSAEIWYAMDAISGSYAITTTVAGAGSSQQITLAEFAGVLTQGALDGTQTDSGSGTTPSSGSIPQSTPYGLFIASWATISTSSPPNGVSSGWVALGTGGTQVALGGYLLSTDNAAHTGTTGASPTTTWVGCGASFHAY